MRSRSRVVVLAVLAACRIPDVTFTKVGDGSGGPGGPGEPASDAPLDSPVDATPPPQLRSCNNLPSNCGASGTGYCCDSAVIPGGTFFRDYDVAHDGHSGTMNFRATVSDFRLDKYEVTVGRFRAFVAAGMGTQATAPASGDGAHPKLANSGWDSAAYTPQLEASTAQMLTELKNSTDATWTDLPTADSENRPINMATWFEAMAFCIWDGGYLPTQAEWTYAAAGGNEQRAFAWSDPPETTEITAERASFSPQMDQCNGGGPPGCTVDDLIPVGTRPDGDGRWRQSDLAGNVYEWNLDWVGPYPVPCDDCARLTQGNPANRVMRGGAFVYPADVLRNTAHGEDPPTQRNYIAGIRCARAP
jgi:formylglycine-generating enzyme required for sulfatase activity